MLILGDGKTSCQGFFHSFVQASSIPLALEEIAWLQNRQAIECLAEKRAEIPAIQGEQDLCPSQCAKENWAVFANREICRTVQCKDIALHFQA